MSLDRETATDLDWRPSEWASFGRLPMMWPGDSPFTKGQPACHNKERSASRIFPLHRNSADKRRSASERRKPRRQTHERRVAAEKADIACRGNKGQSQKLIQKVPSEVKAEKEERAAALEQACWLRAARCGINALAPGTAKERSDTSWSHWSLFWVPRLWER